MKSRPCIKCGKRNRGKSDICSRCNPANYKRKKKRKVYKYDPDKYSLPQYLDDINIDLDDYDRLDKDLWDTNYKIND